MKKKGVSFDEKRERLLKIFHDRNEVLNLKELEKYGPKAGIVLQTVKEVLESLLSDDLVETDKIGAANFYWSLPSKAFQNLSNKCVEFKQNTQKIVENKQHVEVDLMAAQEGREDTEERRAKMEKMKQLKQKYEESKKSIEKYKRNDPERLKSLETEAKAFKDKANLWTDNIFTTKQWITNKYPSYSEDDINKNFQIPAELENL